LTDIKVMMVECLGALQRLRLTTDAFLPDVERFGEPPDSVSPHIAQQIGFDIEATQRLLAEQWTPRQEALLNEHFPQPITTRARLWREWPDTSWMDEETWLTTLTTNGPSSRFDCGSVESFTTHFDMQSEVTRSPMPICIRWSCER
jgi:hypothetical protein